MDITEVKALIELAVKSHELGRYEDAITIYDDIVAEFDSTGDPAVQGQVARALRNKGIELEKLGRHSDAIATYDDVISKFDHVTEPTVREIAASALVSKIGVLIDLEEYLESIELSDRALSHLTKVDENALFVQIADTLYNKAYALSKLKRFNDAVAACDDLIARFNELSDSTLREQVARALVSKAHFLNVLGRYQDAIAASDDVGTRFSKVGDELVADALINKTSSFYGLGRYEDAIEACDDAIARLSNTPEANEQIGVALVNKSHALRQLARYDDAIAVCDKVVDQFARATETESQERVIQALLSKADSLTRLERYDDALVIYEDVIARLRGADKESFGGQRARPLFDKDMLLANLLDFGSATTVDEVADRFIHVGDRMLAAALANKSIILHHLSDDEDAIITCDDIVQRFWHSNDFVLVEQVATALIRKAYSLLALERYQEAIKASNKLIDRFGDSHEIVMREHVAEALENRSIALSKLGRNADVIERPAFERAQIIDLQQKRALRAEIIGSISRPRGMIHWRALGLAYPVQVNLALDPAEPAFNRYADEQTEGLLARARSPEEILNLYLEAQKVPVARRSRAAADIHRIIAEVKGTKPNEIGKQAAAETFGRASAQMLASLTSKERKAFLKKHYKGFTKWDRARPKDRDPVPLDFQKWVDVNFPDRKELGLVFSDLRYLDPQAYRKILNWKASSQDFGFPSNRVAYDASNPAPTGTEVFEAERRGDPRAPEMRRHYMRDRYHRPRR